MFTLYRAAASSSPSAFTRPRRFVFPLAFLLALTAFVNRPVADAATLPAGFAESQIANNLSSGTAMAFAPDGRLFVCQQNGQLRVIKNNALLPTPFLSLSVDSSGERGLLGVAFDPNFAANNYVYVYYTVPAGPGVSVHNRVSRFTAAGDVAVAGSESIVLELNDLSGATNHNGGAIHFGPDGKLYVAVGENANTSHAQNYGNLLGKILRLNADGSVPGDNPTFGGQTSGVNRAIWAMGLRNPYTFAFQPGTGRMFINDVGQNTWEEINDGIAGSNYGWPATEGATNNPLYRAPLYAYAHNGSGVTGCAITGGVFYNPVVNQFPNGYTGKYFFADYCSGWIKVFDPAKTGMPDAVSDFASNVPNAVDLRIGPDGALYYLARGNGGGVFKVTYPTTATILTPAPNTLYKGGETISYSGAGSEAGNSTLPDSAFTWRVDFHHDGQVTNVVPATSGAKTGSFVVPTIGITSANVFYRITLTVRDSANGTVSVSRDVLPMKSMLTLNSNPAGLQLSLDNQIVTAPITVPSVVGVVRRLSVVSPQTFNNLAYNFVSWSNGGGATHDVATPTADATFTATFTPDPQAMRLLTEENSERAIALEAISMMRDPFPIINLRNFLTDQRSHVMLFAVNLQLLAGENASSVTAQATDNQQRTYALPVELVDKVPGYDWLTEIIVKLPEEAMNAGDLRVGITLRGTATNKVLISTVPQ